jgi:acetolactate synthase I/II/III large subunit
MAIQRSIEGETRIGDAVINVLAEAGIEYVVGIPGGHTGILFSALYEHPTIRTVLVREESVGTVMAEAFGRLRGAPIAVMGQGEWIVGNAGQGVIESLLGASPMLILTDMTDAGALSHHGAYQDGSGNYGSWDIRKSLEGVCKRVMVSHYPAQAVQHTQLAVKHALDGEQGPVAVVYHSDSLKGRLHSDSRPTVYPTSGYLVPASSAVDAKQLDEVAELLKGARRPVIIAGNGIRVGQAREQLASFARAWDSPIVTTSSGKGVYPETAEYSGGVLGAFGWPSANSLLADADVVLAVGTKLGPIDTCDESESLFSPERHTLIQIDREQLNMGWTYPVAAAVVGDARIQLPQLETRLATLGSREEAAVDRISAAKERFFPLDLLNPQDHVDARFPLLPQVTITRLAESVPDDVIMSCDAGENRLFMMRWFKVPARGDYLQPSAGGGMGYAVPAAMGARLAFPDRPAVAVCGDGGLAMSLHSLMTAVQEELAIAVVVLNNGALGWVAHGMGKRAIASHFAEFDHAAIARAIGCDGIQVTTLGELDEAFSRIPDLRRPLLIDVPTSMEVSFKDLASTYTSGPRRETGY